VRGLLQIVASFALAVGGAMLAELTKREYAEWSGALARILVRLAAWIHPPRQDEWTADIAFLQSGDASHRGNGLWEAGHHLLAAPKLQVLAISGAYRRVRRDPTVRLGGWLFAGAIGTIVSANLSRAIEYPAADAEFALGVFLCMTGFYLGSLRDRLRVRKTVVHRALFATALAGVCWTAGWTLVGIGSTDTGQGLAAASWWGTNVGAVLAMVAGLIGLVSVTVVHRRTMGLREHRSTPIAVDVEQGPGETEAGTETNTRLSSQGHLRGGQDNRRRHGLRGRQGRPRNDDASRPAADESSHDCRGPLPRRVELRLQSAAIPPLPAAGDMSARVEVDTRVRLDRSGRRCSARPGRSGLEDRSRLASRRPPPSEPRRIGHRIEVPNPPPSARS